MRALRQFVQVLNLGFCPAAARAEQVPSHRNNAEPLRRELNDEGLEKVLRGNAARMLSL